jgi:hypothetical protein
MPRDAHRLTRRHTPRSRSTERAQPCEHTASPQQLLRKQHNIAHVAPHCCNNCCHANTAANAAAAHSSSSPLHCTRRLHTSRNAQHAQCCSNMIITGCDWSSTSTMTIMLPELMRVPSSRPSKEAHTRPRGRASGSHHSTLALDPPQTPRKRLLHVAPDSLPTRSRLAPYSHPTRSLLAPDSLPTRSSSHSTTTNQRHATRHPAHAARQRHATRMPRDPPPHDSATCHTRDPPPYDSMSLRMRTQFVSRARNHHTPARALRTTARRRRPTLHRPRRHTRRANSRERPDR